MKIEVGISTLLQPTVTHSGDSQTPPVTCSGDKRMHSPGINGEGELRGQPAKPGSPGKMAVKTECVCVCVCVCFECRQ